MIAVNAIGPAKLRVGGEVYDRIVRGKDLVGDILPPQAYIIEPYLEATLAVNDAQNVRGHRDRLTQLHKEYDERMAHRRQAGTSIPPFAISSCGTLAAPAAKFWTLTEGTLLPAFGKGRCASGPRSLCRTD